VNIPQGSPILALDLIKRGKITKNKRFFSFFSDRILYFKVKNRSNLHKTFLL